MIQFEQAFEMLMSETYCLGEESVELQESLGRVLAEDVFSDIDMPPFIKSAMDGFACRKEDIDNKLKIVEVIPAGKIPENEIEENQCAKIMTGAPLPKGADTVFIVEESEETQDGYVEYIKPDIKKKESKYKRKSNICKLGEDIKKGTKVLSKGILLKSQHISVMATVGHVSPIVSIQPKVGVIATGSELVEPEIKPGISQIRNSNGSQMIAQLNAMNVVSNYYGIAEDDEQITYDIIHKASVENDVVMLSGGVSMGDFDFVTLILKKLGFEIKFDSIAVQPGKPTTFACANKKFCFGMPGNPVSSFIQFEMMAKPFLYKLMGHNFRPPVLKIPLGKDYFRKRAQRLAFVPVNFTESGEVLPVEYHGSAHINGLVPAEGIMKVPVGKDRINKGELIDVRQI